MNEVEHTAGETSGPTLHDLAGFLRMPAPLAARALGAGAAEARAISSARVRGFLEERGADFSFRVIAHVNMRGGIGKTTASVALAVRAAQAGFRTCLLDLDSQASASLALGVTAEEDDPVFYDTWQDPEADTAAALREIAPGLSLLPSSLQNGLLDSALASPVSQKNAVKGVCEALRALGFDLVVIDCPPSLGAAVISTICAADAVTIPTGADAFSFKGIELTMREIASICDTFHVDPPAVKILYSRYDRREKTSIEALERLKRDYPGQLLPEVIRTSAEYVRALDGGRTIFSAPGRSRAKEDYDGYVRLALGLDPLLEAAPELVKEVPVRAPEPARVREKPPEPARDIATGLSSFEAASPAGDEEAEPRVKPRRRSDEEMSYD